MQRRVVFSVTETISSLTALVRGFKVGRSTGRAIDSRDVDTHSPGKALVVYDISKHVWPVSLFHGSR